MQKTILKFLIILSITAPLTSYSEQINDPKSEISIGQNLLKLESNPEFSMYLMVDSIRKQKDSTAAATIMKEYFVPRPASIDKDTKRYLSVLNNYIFNCQSYSASLVYTIGKSQPKGKGAGDLLYMADAQSIQKEERFSPDSTGGKALQTICAQIGFQIPENILIGATDTTKVYFSKSNIYRINNFSVQSWIITDFLRPMFDESSGKYFKSQLKLKSFNCKERYSTFLDGAIYENEMGTGNYLSRIIPTEPKVQYPLPKSIGEAELDSVCSYFQ